jgi:RNA polymerase sigma factor (sigma-70 family)
MGPLRVRSLDTLNDERLAALVHRGDDEAFSVLYDRYRVPLARYCRSIVREPEDASDAQQNAMVSALRALRKRRLTGRVRPWLYRIAHNESISVLRRRRESVELDQQIPAPARHEESLERWEVLISDLRSLPERQRGALVMRELAGLEYDEIGLALSMKPASARKAVFEARVALGETAAGRLAGCDEIRRRISDGDRRVLRARRVRGHLDECSACGAFELSVRERQGVLELIPVPLGGVFGGVGMSGLGLGAGGVASSGGGFGHGGGGVGIGSGVGVGGGVGGAAALGGGSLAVKGIAACAVCFVAGAGVIFDGGLHHGHRGARSGHARSARVAHATRHAPAGAVAVASVASPVKAASATTASRSAARSTARVAVRRPGKARAPQGGAATGGRAPARILVRGGGGSANRTAPRLGTHPAVHAPTIGAAPAATSTGTIATPVTTTTSGTTSTPTSTAQPASATPVSLAQLAQDAISAGWSLAAQAGQAALTAYQQDGSTTSTTTSSVQGLLSKFLSGGS